MSKNIIPIETSEWVNKHIFQKETLRPGRLVAAVIVYGTFLTFLSLYWRKMYKVAGKLILPFGISALYAYSAHIPIRGVIDLLISGGVIPSTLFSNMVMQISAVCIVWVLTSKKILAPNLQNLRFWYLFPLVLGFILLIIILLNQSPILLPYFLRALVYWITWFPVVLIG